MQITIEKYQQTNPSITPGSYYFQISFDFLKAQYPAQLKIYHASVTISQHITPLKKRKSNHRIRKKGNIRTIKLYPKRDNIQFANYLNQNLFQQCCRLSSFFLLHVQHVLNTQRTVQIYINYTKQIIQYKSQLPVPPIAPRGCCSFTKQLPGEQLEEIRYIHLIQTSMYHIYSSLTKRFVHQEFVTSSQQYLVNTHIQRIYFKITLQVRYDSLRAHCESYGARKYSQRVHNNIQQKYKSSN
eukprot:TRINITY_DN2878_c1_g2_i8.p3 TRINITY_DN2878_c1_g2~~TRINITY_DN2878_c1_g2_i8.p3  ORF type:complete len:261 (-),score=-18.57 TRINITY_DN2878_c1_g2_i8:724-1446(-)